MHEKNKDHRQRKSYKYGIACVIVVIAIAAGAFIIREKNMNTEDFYTLEVESSNKKRQEAKRCCGPDTPPQFSFGLEYLGIDAEQNVDKIYEQIRQYAKKQLDSPETLACALDDPQVLGAIQSNGDFFEFSSVLDQRQTARFKYVIQPENSVGRKVAVIIVMHWNGVLDKYDKVVSYMRKFLLPISTFIHVPAARGLNPGADSPEDYESVSPNIGKTVFRTMQDAQDIQLMARFLKQKMGYEEVGLFTYSIGSLRGVLASIGDPGLFDFGVFHMVADDFSDAVMHGVGTQDIADEIGDKISYDVLDSMWSVISPGRYVEHYVNLPRKTRIVQAKYDFVFGGQNVENLNYIILKKRPDIELAKERVGHSTFGRFPVGVEVLLRDISFIYKNTKMKESPRAKLFLFFDH